MLQKQYRIAILGGTGAQGTGLALRLAKSGHTVTIGSRDADKARAAASAASARTGQTIAGADNRGAASSAEIVAAVMSGHLHWANYFQWLLPATNSVCRSLPQRG